MRLPTAVRCVGYVAVLMAFAVAGDRLLAQRLYAEPERLVPAYRSFNERSVGIKLRELEQTSARLDTLLLGNSRTLFGVDPAAFDRRLAAHGVRRTTFNLAMPTIDVRFWPPFFARFYDREPARHMLLGVIPRDLDVRNRVAEQQALAFRASPGFLDRDRSLVWKDAEEALADLFSLRGRGNEIRHAVPGDLLNGRKLDRFEFGLQGERGVATFAPELTPSKPRLARLAARLGRRSGTIRLRIGEEQIAALVALDRRVRAGGGCLTLFTLPVLYDREPYGTVEFERDFRRVLRGFVREHPTVALADIGPEVEGDYGLADFADGDHLSPRGAKRFSAQLADAVAPRLRRPGCSEAGPAGR